MKVKPKKFKKLNKKKARNIILAEVAVMVIAVGGVFAATASKDNEPEVVVPEGVELSDETLALKDAMDEAKAAEDEAKEKMDAAEDKLRKLDRKLHIDGEKTSDVRKRAEELTDFVATEEAAYLAEKASIEGEAEKALERYNNCGWYFLNSKATTSLEYWTAKARAYSGTSAAANTSLFSSALSDAVKYDNLIIASQQIDKSNSLGGTSRQIDYNLMTSAAVSVAVYTANHSLTHTFAWKVIGSNYGPWADENLAYGMNAARAWVVWYDNEAATNGAHFRNINNKGRNTTGYGYTVKGSPAPSHAQEFGVNSSGSVLTTPAQFREDLTKFRDEAKAAYDEAVVKSALLKNEPIPLAQAKASLNTVRAKLKKAGKEADIKYLKLFDKASAARADYNEKHEIYLAAKKAYEDAVAKETGQEEPSEEGDSNE